MDEDLQELVIRAEMELEETQEVIKTALSSLHQEFLQTDELLTADLKQKQVEVEHKSQILRSLIQERERLSFNQTKSIDFPSTSFKNDMQELILLHHKISGITWNFKDERISGQMGSKFFRYSTECNPSYETVNKLWDLLDEIN